MTGRSRRRERAPGVSVVATLLALAALAMAQPVWAQAAANAASNDASAEPAAPAEHGDPPGADEAEDERRPFLLSIGVAGGFPAYQTGTFRVAMQDGFVGADVRLGYGPRSGLAYGAALRGYPPLPGMPVPIWVGGGLMATGSSVAPFAAAGVHVPVAQRVRIDVEAGAAWTRLGLERNVVPHLQLGVSYAFAVRAPETVDQADATSQARRERAGPACEPGEPDPGLLSGALRRATRRFLDDAEATYGSLYRSLRYDLDVTGERIEGDEAVLDLAYDGSVVEIASGERISASGTATATFRWNGCAWSWTGVDY